MIATFSAVLLVYVAALSPASQSVRSLAPQSDASPGSKAFHISVSGVRPLEQAVDNLHREFGWTIDYEDPPHPAAMNAREMQPATAPAKQSFEFDVRPSGSSAVPAADKTIEEMVRSYNQSGNS